jgi:dihydroorotate dehydrogenase (NAD+) catalytic subunit
VLSGLIGGYSGPPIRPIAIRCILEIRRELGAVPIVGCGGVAHADHAVEFLLAGATAVAIGSAHFDTPRVGAKVRKGIGTYMDRHGFARVGDLIGAFTPWT